jgi:hypothetical protein
MSTPSQAGMTLIAVYEKTEADMKSLAVIKARHKKRGNRVYVEAPESGQHAGMLCLWLDTIKARAHTVHVNRRSAYKTL